MKMLFFECKAGAAGDMLAAALFELLDNQQAMTGKLNSIGLVGVAVEIEKVKRCGLSGTKFSVKIGDKEESVDESHHHHHDEPHHHHHATLEEVFKTIDALNVSEKVKSHSKQIYESIAEAEAKAHGAKVGEVHFHEVGAKDAIFDVVATSMMIEELRVDKILCSVPEVGGGLAYCAHGTVPVPAPATVNILKDIPFTSGAANCELLTPTGAAILKHFSTKFGPMPPMTVKAIGIGCGTRDLHNRPNIVRAFLGEAIAESGANGKIVELRANIDDMTGEDLAHACEMIRDAGALDVSVAPILMKKGRIGNLLMVIAKVEDETRMAQEILSRTSTIGVRCVRMDRYEMKREIILDERGRRVKMSKGFGVEKSKPEFDDRITP